MTADDLIQLKQQPHDTLDNQYIALLKELEFYLTSSTDPTASIQEKTGAYDLKAKLILVHQFFTAKPHIANDLYLCLGLEDLTEEETFIEDKYADALIETF